MVTDIEIKAGAVVAFNMLPDATWFDVVSCNGFALIVKEHGTNNAVQRIDTSVVARVARYVVREIPGIKALPEYKFAVLDTKRVKYIRYCASLPDAMRVMAERNATMRRIGRKGRNG